MDLRIEPSDDESMSMWGESMSSDDEEYESHHNLRIVPSGDESVYEAYHTVFSMLLTTDIIYKKLAGVCGSIYKTSKNIQQLISKNRNENMIFSTFDEADLQDTNANIVTHYQFYFGKGDQQIYDPYRYFQVPNTHGNCFAFALYLSSKLVNTPERHCELFPFSLIPVCKFIRQETKLSYSVSHRHLIPTVYTYVNVSKSDFELMYTINDNRIVFNLFNILHTNHDIREMVQAEWDTLTPNEKKMNDIPLNPQFTLEIYLDQLLIFLNEYETIDMTNERFEVYWGELMKEGKLNFSEPSVPFDFTLYTNKDPDPALCREPLNCTPPTRGGKNRKTRTHKKSKRNKKRTTIKSKRSIYYRRK